MESISEEITPEVPPDIRNSYIHDVSQIEPYDEKERNDLVTTLQWLRTAPKLNKPHNMDEHLGVLAILISPDRRKTFLLNHRKAQLWLPPGGHVDLGQKLSECVIDETRQELGISNPKLLVESPVFLSRTLTQGKNAGHIDTTAWYLLQDNPESIYTIQDKEASESMWIEIDKILETPEFLNLHRGFSKIKKLAL